MPIRPAQPDDAPAIARVHVDTWRTAYNGLISASFLASLSYERRTAQWERDIAAASTGATCVFVAESQGTVVGFASGGPPQNTFPGYDGELYALYILAEAQGQGWGQALLRAVAAHLAGNGATSLLVWALEGGPANRFYTRMGGVYLTTKSFTIGPDSYNELGYGWPDVSQLTR
ncbi:MAG: GNAT family N-acetyltransferase [Chloroflexaceae bacterium]|jgi:ribosomal protein S18 acetylase RimI-like enzyme|nr:GNAT family N-acetyltransferase [Chloroflexaceae bacterium]